MHILLIGASGRNGSLILQSALSRDYTVTALVRSLSASSLPSHPNLTLIAGSPISQSDLEGALQSPASPDAVIVALGHRRTGDSPFAPPAPDCPHDLMESTTRSLLNAIQAVRPSKQPKIIVNSSQGVGASLSSMFFALRLVFNYSKAMRMGLEDHAKVDAIVRESGLPFVLARPCRLSEGPAQSVRAWPDDGRGASWFATVSRASVAEWLLDAVESNEFNGRAPVLTN
ncbi:hypothetical protein FDECE_16161 [Fusarium decemcellulare]|nr:hypothetical protein FDECE_16161 [Fusarium decemcellulare]